MRCWEGEPACGSRGQGRLGWPTGDPCTLLLTAENIVTGWPFALPADDLGLESMKEIDPLFFLSPTFPDCLRVTC